MAHHHLPGVLTSICHDCDALAVAFVRHPGSHAWETFCEPHTPWGDPAVAIAAIDYHGGVPLPLLHDSTGERRPDPDHDQLTADHEPAGSDDPGGF